MLGEQLGCLADARQTLRVRGMGCAYANRGVTLGDTPWDFDGQEIFKRAVQGMTQAQRSGAGEVRRHAPTTSISSCRTRPICASSRRW